MILKIYNIVYIKNIMQRGKKMLNVSPFEERLFITYLDECEPYIFENEFIKSIVSLSCLKSNYISNLEKDWKILRDKFNIPANVYLHFTAIKNLLSSKKNTHDLNLKKIFEDKFGNIDLKKLYDFYNDILSIIEKNYFVVQCTGIKYNKEKVFLKELTNENMHIAFYEHLDKMSIFLTDYSNKDYNNKKRLLSLQGKKDDNLKYKHYFTKLRYDGNYELSERNDYRNAFTHCIADGTKNFKSKTTRELFDTLRFIPKSEVGLNCDSTLKCPYSEVSHAGMELVDFIAIYVSRNIWKEYYKEYLISKGMNNNDIDIKIENQCLIKIGNYNPIDPYTSIKKKIFNLDYDVKIR